MCRKVFLFLILFQAVFVWSVSAQRYNFDHYDIEDGLSQSQVRGITQGANRRLWISTLGGLSSFNGKQFCTYGKSDGLPGNFCTDVLSTANGLIIGTTEGPSRYDYKRFYSYSSITRGDIKLIAASSNRTYALQSGKLFEVLKSTLRSLSVTGSAQDIVTSIDKGPDGLLWAAVYQKGLFYLENHRWHSVSINHKLKDLIIHGFLIESPKAEKATILTRQGIFTVTDEVVAAAFPMIKSWPTSIAKDGQGDYWIGTAHGAWQIGKQGAILFNSTNGLTESEVSSIFKDVEGNIWLGTNGDGLYKYSGNNYVTFDNTQGLRSKIVMAFSKSPVDNELLIGTTNGLYSNIRGKITEIKIPSHQESARNIVFLTPDSKAGKIWIGTAAGLWIYNGKTVTPVDAHFGRYFFNGLMEDSSGRTWLTAEPGIFIYDVLKKNIALVINDFGGKVLELNRNTMIVGGQGGVYLMAGNFGTKRPLTKKIFGLSILSMIKVGDNVLFGTSDYGVFIWNRKKGTLKNLSTKKGLPSDHIYSMMLDRKGFIWLGTGKGVSKLRASDFSVIPNSSSQYMLAESNQNAILETEDGIWVGTTKGAVLYPAKQVVHENIKPYIYISSVNAVDSRKDNQITLLPYDQNRITINYTGIYFRNPKSLRFTYRLLGLDTAWSSPTSDASMTFRAIPAGKYIFQAKVKTTEGLSSENTASYSFEISTPYYQRGWFRAFLLLLTACLIVLSVYGIFTLGERRRKLRLKIKLEEQSILRKQTAEDFHDDLGNKLTRITVLSEVLKSMIGPDEMEKLGVLQKIAKNVDELYSGTRDILWSLNPKNDHLNQLLEHIRDFGIEMFNETSISFSYEIALHGNNTKLSLDMSRNILMILKESINNVLKHSNATKVLYSAILNSEFLLITLEDNGQGFDTEYARNGHGVNNMFVRAKRINADLSLQSTTTGTSVCLMINFSTLKQQKNV